VTELGVERLRVAGEAFMRDVSREQYLAHAGLKAAPELQAVYARHAAALGDDALEMALELLRDAPPESEDRRSARALVEWLAESRASRELAALDEREASWEGSAIVRGADGTETPYGRIAIDIANEPDRTRRHALDDARAAIVTRELSPLREERLRRERDLVESMDLADGYVPAFEMMTGIDLAGLANQCEAFLRDTQAAWDDTFPALARRELGIEPGQARRADALALFRGRAHDRYFQARELEPQVRRQVSEMGLDPEAGGRIVFDTGERAGKRPRAFCAPVRIPQEMFLVLRPHGGQSDYMALLHELGHALHFAHMREELPFEHRWLGDNSVTEGYAMLFDHLLQDRGWLMRYTPMSRRETGAVLRATGVAELHAVRRYCAKLLYELRVYDGSVPWRSLPDLYVTLLGSATSCRYFAADAFCDLDPRFYSARYLRAWQLQAVLAEALRSRFDEDWFRNPQAGPWIAGELFGEGQRETADELATRVLGRQLSFDPVAARAQRLLEAA